MTKQSSVIQFNLYLDEKQLVAFVPASRGWQEERQVAEDARDDSHRGVLSGKSMQQA
jgi:hypothetical protein